MQWKYEYEFCDYRNARQWTPIDCAAASGKENIVQLLIDAKVEIDPRGINNVSHVRW